MVAQLALRIQGTEVVLAAARLGVILVAADRAPTADAPAQFGAVARGGPLLLAAMHGHAVADDQSMAAALRQRDVAPFLVRALRGQQAEQGIGQAVVQRCQAPALLAAHAQRHRLGQHLGPARTLRLRKRAVVGFAKAGQLHAIVFVQQHLGVTQVAPVQLHPHGERISEQMLTELRGHALALLQQAGQLTQRKAGGMAGRGKHHGADASSQSRESRRCGTDGSFHGRMPVPSPRIDDAAGRARSCMVVRCRFRRSCGTGRRSCPACSRRPARWARWQMPTTCRPRPVRHWPP